jgi:hypothetical protein
MRFTAFSLSLVGAWVLGGVQVASATEPRTVEQALAARSAEKWPMFGVMADAGIPDGANASLVVRPWHWLRGYAGGGTNSIARGWRTGASLLPFGAGPSLSVEYGHYGEGNANGLVGHLVQGGWEGSPILDRVGYDYANAHVGLDFGGKYFVFFIHGGISRVVTTVHNMDAAISNGTKSNPSVTGSTTVVVNQDPTLKVVGSSLKIGLILFLL